MMRHRDTIHAQRASSEREPRLLSPTLVAFLVLAASAPLGGCGAPESSLESGTSGVRSDGSDFPSLDEALPWRVDAASIAPVFDFDGDSCLPAAGISRGGDQNGGLQTSGSVVGACRWREFLDVSNTVHRYACHSSNGNNYCGHFYALYFEKDQLASGFGGHRHDWEYAAVWTVNGQVTHGSVSAHGDLTTKSASEVEFENGHLKVVYHKDGLLTHSFRFADRGEVAENPYGRFVTPKIISWYEFRGDGHSNLVMRTLLNGFDYGSANLPVADWTIVSSLNEFKPWDYPEFNWGDALAANGGSDVQFVQFVNEKSGLCMDIAGGRMQNGTNVGLWNCNGGRWQKWYHDAGSGLIRSHQDPRFCLDNSSRFENGANILIWWCWGGDPQRFVNNGNGTFSVDAARGQVLDTGSEAGANVGTWGYWGGANQRWRLVP